MKGQTPRILKSGRHTVQFYRTLWDTIADGRVWRGHLCNRHQSGELLDVDQTITPIRDEHDGISHYFVVYVDRSGRLHNENALAQPVLVDSLTGLPNRDHFQARLGEALARSRRSGKAVGVLLLNLDQFKSVNDRYGQGSGDDLLGQVGRRLTSTLRDTDLVARLSGDAFAMLIEDMTSQEQAIDSSQRLLELLTAPFNVRGALAQLTASIGIAISGASASTPERLLHHADVAMLGAKARGGSSCFQFHDMATDIAARQRHGTRAALRTALRSNHLSLMYQPQVDLRSGRAVGAEALLRWKDPVRGWVPPAEFIALAEEDGMLLALNDWVLYNATAQMASLRVRIPEMVPVAVNLSASQFDRVELTSMVEGLLAMHGLPGSALRLEITETAMLRASRVVHDNLLSLASMGVQVSVDDFGTGYSSLPSLREFPLNAIKVDVSYVGGIGRSRRDEQLISAIICLAQKLGLDVIAEGVETAEQRDFLLAEGCTVAQGHFYAGALPIDDFVAWMRRGDGAERAPEQIAHRNT